MDLKMSIDNDFNNLKKLNRRLKNKETLLMEKQYPS